MNESSDLQRDKKTGENTVVQAVELCFLYIDNIRLKVVQMAEVMRASKSFDEKSFFEIVDMLDVFVELISDIYKARRKDNVFDGFCAKTVQALEVHLLFVLKALLAARRKKDLVMVMDLLENELIENIIQWKLKVMPELRKIK